VLCSMNKQHLHFLAHKSDQDRVAETSATDGGNVTAVVQHGLRALAHYEFCRQSSRAGVTLRVYTHSLAHTRAPKNALQNERVWYGDIPSES
jgi:hypothetical protein